MSGGFYRQTGADAGGGDILLESDAKLKRIALLAAVVAAALLVVVGACFSLRARRSAPRQVERMELDVSRALDTLLHAGEDVAAPVEAVDALATRWRAVFREWKDIPFVLQPTILKLQELQDKTVPRWRAVLASADSLALRRRTVLEDVLREQTNWPPPPPPPVVLAFSDGIRDFGNGAVEGAVWPWLVWRRAWSVHQSVSRGQIGQANAVAAVRVVLFPYTSAGLTFGMILGFAAFVALFGYGFCHLGMRLNAGLFSLFGLLYFLYAVVWAVFVSFLFFGVLP